MIENHGLSLVINVTSSFVPRQTDIRCDGVSAGCGWIHAADLETKSLKSTITQPARQIPDLLLQIRVSLFLALC